MNYAEILQNIGYKLNDRGKFWNTNALFRGGDNNTAISIFKDSGIWTDWVETGGTTHYPFSLLYEKTTGKKFDDSNLTVNYFRAILKHELLKEEKTFPKSCLKKLLPDYEYFERRGIKSSTQRDYKCGLATGGKLYQRIVFPIYRFDGQIHGFDGRKVLEDDENKPKWSHYGKSADWFYPYFSVEGVGEQIKEENRVFIVESIGDSMSLCQAGIKNNLVTFTNRLGPKIISKLSGLGVDICLSFNNDCEKKQNRGFDGSLVSLLKLIDSIDLNKIYFTPPPDGDFGEMDDFQIQDCRKSLDFSKESHYKGIKRLIDYAPKAKIAKSLMPKVKKLEKMLEEL